LWGFAPTTNPPLLLHGEGNRPYAIALHYRRWQEDLRLMRNLSQKAYRFSISWPRLLPEGRGKVSQKGLEFYDKLVDGLLEAEIVPFVTLYHWDLPQALQDQGGWAERHIVDAFVEYSDLVSRKLGDRVKNWITFNEPAVVTYLGHLWGHFAPGISSPTTSIQVAHHLLLSHGCSVPVLRANSPGAEVGITLDMPYHVPASDSEHDAAAARMATGTWLGWFIDPLYGRPYPQEVIETLSSKGILAPEALKVVLDW
jgi:beta-glucosidase